MECKRAQGKKIPGLSSSSENAASGSRAGGVRKSAGSLVRLADLSRGARQRCPFSCRLHPMAMGARIRFDVSLNVQSTEYEVRVEPPGGLWPQRP